MYVVDYIRTIPGGAPVTAGTTVTLRKLADGSSIGTAATDANGKFTYQQDGHPGPYYYEVTSGGVTKRHASSSTGYAGPFALSELGVTFQAAFSDGVCSGIDGGLQVTAPGTGMTVNVANGAALVKSILCRYYTALTALAIAASDPTNPRHDLIVVEVGRVGAIDEGRATIKVVTGPPAATPVDPTLTQSSTVWQFPLARVQVDAGVSTIAAGKVTDLRTSLLPVIADGSIVAAKLAADTLTAAQIAPNAIGPSELADGSVTSAKILDGTIVDADIAAGAAIAGSKIARNPPLANSAFRSGNTTAPTSTTCTIGTTTGGEATTMAASVTLLSGVTYDIFVVCCLRIAPQGAYKGCVGVDLNGSRAVYLGHPDTNGGEITQEVFTLGVVGAGAAWTATALVGVSSAGTADYGAGRITIKAFPRT